VLSSKTIQEEKEPSLEEHLRGWFSHPDMSLRFIPYLEMLWVEAGKMLFRQGDEPDSLYILISGRISIYLEKYERKRIRVLTMRSGSIMGEMGLYTSSGRTATAETDTRSHLAILSVKAFNRMQKDDPEVAAEVHKFIVTLLSKRVARADQALSVLIP
jgi:SulP family sulfate permease